MCLKRQCRKVSSELKTGKDLLLTKLLYITHDKWNKHFNDDYFKKQQNKINASILQSETPVLPNEETLPNASFSLPHESGKNDSTLNSFKVKNAKTNNKTKVNANVTRSSSTSASFKIFKKSGTIPRKLPFIRGTILKPSINTKNKKVQDSKMSPSSFSSQSDKSISQLPVKNKIRYFEKLCQRRNDSIAMSMQSSNISKGSTGSMPSEESFVYSETDTIYDVTHSTNDQTTISGETLCMSVLDRSMTLNSSMTSLEYNSFMQKINTECVIMMQAAKALRLSRDKIQCFDSDLMLESERALLIAGIKRDLLVKELRADISKIRNVEETRSTAQISLSNLRFPLKLNADRYKYKTWYTALFHYKSKMYATGWAEVSPNQNYVYFPESFVFDGVSPNFEVYVTLYKMQVSTNNLKNSMSCIQMNNHREHRIFQTLTYRDPYTRKMEQVKIPLTSFSFCAQLQINKDSLHGNQIYHLSKVSNNSVLDGTAYMHTEISNLCMNEDFAGFLTVGTDLFGRIIWDRKWTQLKNSSMSFWDYPSQAENETPKLSINLKYCSDKQIEVAGKGLCGRSRTFIIKLETSTQKAEDSFSLNSTKYYLTADTIKDMETWRKKLNSVLTSLTLWQ